MKLRESKGGVKVRGTKLHMRITVSPQKRVDPLLPWCTDLATAQARAEATQVLVNRLRAAGQTDFVEKLVMRAAQADAEKFEALGRLADGLVAGELVKQEQSLATARGGAVTFEAFAMRWVNGELANEFPDYVERKRSAYTDLCNLRRYVFPVIGDRPIASITLDDYERVMREIPARATKLRTQSKGARARRPEEEARAARAVKGRTLRPATRRQVAQVTRRVLQLAEYPAKVIARNPVAPSAMPRVRTVVALQYIYPSEDAQLLACTKVDLGYRLLYGFLARIGWRKADALGGKLEKVDGALRDEAHGPQAAHVEPHRPPARRHPHPRRRDQRPAHDGARPRGP